VCPGAHFSDVAKLRTYDAVNPGSGRNIGVMCTAQRYLSNEKKRRVRSCLNFLHHISIHHPLPSRHHLHRNGSISGRDSKFEIPSLAISAFGIRRNHGTRNRAVAFEAERSSGDHLLLSKMTGLTLRRIPPRRLRPELIRKDSGVARAYPTTLCSRAVIRSRSRREAQIHDQLE
jgi:hypothetical protein